MGDSLLKKEFKSKDVERVRNLVKKDFSAKTTTGVGYEKQYEVHREGDVWEESGRSWTIKDGIKQNITKLDAAKKAMQMPLKCPKCGGPMKHWLAQKMYKIHGFCFFPCTMEYKATLRQAGLYEQYEKSMIKGGLRAFLQDMEEYYFEQINQVDTFVTEQGDVEDWSNNSSKVKEEALKNLQEFLTHAKKHLQE